MICVRRALSSLTAAARFVGPWQGAPPPFMDVGSLPGPSLSAPWGLQSVREATKKAMGSTQNGRDSQPKNLGVKKSGGQGVLAGNIIVRQRGTKFHPGDYVGIGKDHTLFALKDGRVRFETVRLVPGKRHMRKFVHVDPSEGRILHPEFAHLEGMLEGLMAAKTRAVQKQQQQNLKHQQRQQQGRGQQGQQQQRQL